MTKSSCIFLGLGLFFWGCGSTEPLSEKTTWKMVAELTTPAKIGSHRLKITLLDSTSQPIEKATLVVDPQMPSHGHGSSEKPVIEEKGQGLYEAFPVTFTMAGDWEVIIKAEKNGASSQIILKVSVPAQ